MSDDFLARDEIARAMHQIVIENAVPSIEVIVRKADGRYTNAEVLSLYALAVTTVAITFGRLGIATEKELTSYVDSEVNFFVFKFVGMKDTDDATRSSFFEQCLQLFMRTVDQTEPSVNVAVDLTINGEKNVIMQALKPDIYRKMVDAKRAKIPEHIFMVGTLAMFGDTLTATLRTAREIMERRDERSEDDGAHGRTR